MKPSRPQKKRSRNSHIFVCGSVSPDRTVNPKTYCPDCIPESVRAHLGEQWVDTWELYSDGWCEAPICDVCRMAIPVYVNRTRDGEAIGESY